MSNGSDFQPRPRELRLKDTVRPEVVDKRSRRNCFKCVRHIIVPTQEHCARLDGEDEAVLLLLDEPIKSRGLSVSVRNSDADDGVDRQGDFQLLSSTNGDADRELSSVVVGRTGNRRTENGNGVEVLVVLASLRRIVVDFEFLLRCETLAACDRAFELCSCRTRGFFSEGFATMNTTLCFFAISD